MALAHYGKGEFTKAASVAMQALSIDIGNAEPGYDTANAELVYECARYAARGGHREAALDALEVAVRIDGYNYIAFLAEPDFQAVREDFRSKHDHILKNGMTHGLDLLKKIEDRLHECRSVLESVDLRQRIIDDRNIDDRNEDLEKLQSAMSSARTIRELQLICHDSSELAMKCCSYVLNQAGRLQSKIQKMTDSQAELRGKYGIVIVDPSSTLGIAFMVFLVWYIIGALILVAWPFPEDGYKPTVVGCFLGYGLFLGFPLTWSLVHLIVHPIFKRREEAQKERLLRDGQICLDLWSTGTAPFQAAVRDLENCAQGLASIGRTNECPGYPSTQRLRLHIPPIA